MAKRNVAYSTERTPLHTVIPLTTPYLLTIAPSQVCNFKCGYCIHSESIEKRLDAGIKPIIMSDQTYDTLVRQVQEFSTKLKRLSFAGYGEPLTNPNLPEMVKKAHMAEIADTIMIVTNGALLTRDVSDRLVNSGLTHLFVSLQGLSNASYHKISGGVTFDEIYDNIKYFSSVKPQNVELVVKIVDDGFTDMETEKFHRLFDNICDAVGIEHIVQFQSDIAIASTYQNRFHPEITSDNVKICSSPFWTVVCYADGTLVPCCGYFNNFSQNIANISIKNYWLDWLNVLRLDLLKEDYTRFAICKKCNYKVACVHPEDVIDAHKDEILARIANNLA